MGVPSPVVSVNGVGAVSDDQLNTYIAGGCLLADLRGFIGRTNMTALMIGTTAPNDGGQGVFYWNPAAGLTDDNGITTIVPPAAAAGAWVRLVLH